MAKSIREMLDEGRKRIASIKQGTDDGYGEMHSFRNFLQCDIYHVLQEARVFWESCRDAGMVSTPTEDEIIRELLRDHDGLQEFVKEAFEAFPDADLPGTAIAPMTPRPGDWSSGWCLRYGPRAHPQMQWYGHYQAERMLAPSYRAAVAYVDRSYDPTRPRTALKRGDVYIWNANVRRNTEYAAWLIEQFASRHDDDVEVIIKEAEVKYREMCV